MTSDAAIALGDRICDFLLSCGGPYQRLTGEMQKSTIDALITGQYVLKEKDGAIIFFASYWRLQPEDVEMVSHLKRPLNICTGPIVYVVEAGNKGGGVMEMVRALREVSSDAELACWHRGKKLKHFRLQKGEIA